MKKSTLLNVKQNRLYRDIIYFITQVKKIRKYSG